MENCADPEGAAQWITQRLYGHEPLRYSIIFYGGCR